MLDQARTWQCPQCDHRVEFAQADAVLPACTVCGCGELYKKKDFPHWLGMTILTTACVLSVFTYGWYAKWLTWAILIGSAVVDGLLYLMVGDAVVCYRCHAHHKGVSSGAQHPPFELTVGERYRQQRMRERKEPPAPSATSDRTATS